MASNMETGIIEIVAIYVVIYDIQLGSKGILPEYSRIFFKTGFV